MSDCGIKKSTIFGDKSNFIKYFGGNLIAVEGPNTKEKLLLEQLRIPYKQIIKGNIYLKPGQVNYLLNHLGLGDSCTFLCIAAKYDQKSKFEEDNYVQYAYYNDLSRLYNFSYVLTLSGNSVKRIPQLYLTNPNINYPVYLEVLIAVIDDTYQFFQDVVNQSGLSFFNLLHTDIVTYVPNESIAIMNHDPVPQALAYIQVANINSIEKSGRILIIDDQAVGRIFLEFTDEFNAYQALSHINWMMEGDNRIIQDLNPIEDIIDPVIYFNANTTLIGSTASLPHTSAMGTDFQCTLSLADFGGVITKQNLITSLIYKVEDGIDGLITMADADLTIKNNVNLETNLIVSVGTYVITFTHLNDIANNSIDSDVNVILTIVS